MFVKICLILSLFGIRLSEQADCAYPPENGKSTCWGYVQEIGTSTWNDLYKVIPVKAEDAGFCDGTSQSPIDIPYNGVAIKRDWLPFQLINYDIDPYKMYIQNNGHGAKITFDPRNCNYMPTVIQGGLPGSFELAQFHFHWGDATGAKGSEHTLYGKQFDAELHFVHFNTKCGRDLTEALTNCAGHDALAVLGVFIEEGGNDNHAYDSIIDGLGQVHEESDTKVEIKSFDMTKLMPHDLDEFYRYNGGLTTPTCNEVVTWTVFKNHVKISKKQLAEFFKLTTHSGKGSSDVDVPLLHTFRPVQPLNGRMIYYADLKLRCKHRDWTKTRTSMCDIYYKESDDELGFMESIKSCIGYHYSKTPFQGLIPVGRLRCLRNRFMDSQDDDICGRFFRVNGIKDDNGAWREYPSGKHIDFSHFPDFNPLHGGSGDTLVWDAFLNRLFIQDEHDHYNALCYRDYQGDCDQCIGFEDGRSCLDSGICQDNQCTCDEGFTGMGCRLPPIPDKEVVMVGGESSSSLFSLPAYQSAENLAAVDAANYPYAHSTYCSIASYNEATDTLDHQICDYTFGRGVCCNGVDNNTDTAIDDCRQYNCFTDTWDTIESMPEKLRGHAANKIVHKGRDLLWLVSGGRVEEHNGTVSQKMYALNENLVWSTLTSELPETRFGHCQIQINDCEVAFIGGLIDYINSTYHYVADDSHKQIHIYNYKTMTWRDGPMLEKSVFNATCGMLLDRANYHKKVVIGCGGRLPTAYSEYLNSTGYLVYDYPDIYPTNLPKIQIWDLSTNEIMEMTNNDDMYKCPEDDNDATDEMDDSGEEGYTDGVNDTPSNHEGKFKQLDENYLIYTNALGGTGAGTNTKGVVYYFTLENGFARADGSGYAMAELDTAANMGYHYGGDSFVAPRGTTKCI